MFVVFEGIDGAGKSVQLMRLAEWLRSQGRTVIETREPTDGVWGRRYRAWARGETQADAEEVLRFFVEDRREHVDLVIRPALRKSIDVVCDRYVHSTLAYQAAQGIDRALLRERLLGEAFPEPDRVLWLRIPVATALLRLDRREEAPAEQFERASFLERVDSEYERLGLEPVDAVGTVDDVHARVRERVRELLAS